MEYKILSKYLLEQVIERVSGVPVTGVTVISAIQACAKIDANGQSIKRSEQIKMKEAEIR